MRVLEQWETLALFPKYEVIFVKQHKEIVNKLKEWVEKIIIAEFVKIQERNQATKQVKEL